jgi:multidrug resistance efflux pump
MRTRWAWILGVILLAATIGVPAWYFNRPKEGREPTIAKESLDVVCRGRVDADGLVRPIEPSQPGKVVKVHVKEGDKVKAGAPIVDLDDRAYADAEREAMNAREEAKLGVALAEQKAKQHAADLDALQKDIDSYTATAHGLEMKLKQMKAAYGLTDKVPYTQAEINVQESQLLGLRLEIEAKQMRLDQARKVDPMLEVKLAQLRVEMANETIEKTRRYKRECAILAPSDGTILRLQTASGQLLAPGTAYNPSIVFAPDGPLIVRAEVEQVDVARVKVGMPVTIRDDSRRESPVWTGRVKEVADWIAPRRNMLLEPGEFNDVRTAEAIIAVDPSPERLLIGQRMVIRFGK